MIVGFVGLIRGIGKVLFHYDGMRDWFRGMDAPAVRVVRVFFLMGGGLSICRMGCEYRVCCLVSL